MDSPVTECLTFYFPTSFETSSFDASWAVYKKTLEKGKEVKGFRAASAGWVVEEVEHKGERCKAWVGFLGWESMDASMEYRDTKDFQGTIGALREGSKAIEAYHVEFLGK